MTDTTPKPRQSRLVLAVGLFAAALLLAGAAWCLRVFVIGFSIDPELLQGPINVVRFNGKGMGLKYSISADSPDHARIVEWLRDHRRGWVYDMADYSAHTGLWTPNLRINLAHDRVSIGYDNTAGPSYMTWVSKRIPDAEQPVVTHPAIVEPAEAPRSAGSDPTSVPSTPPSAPR